MFAICKKCRTKFEADGRMFGFIPIVKKPKWQVELIGPENERYSVNYGKMVECPKCGSKWRVHPHKYAQNGCVIGVFMLLGFPVCLFFSRLLAWIWLGLALLPFIFAGGPGKTSGDRNRKGVGRSDYGP